MKYIYPINREFARQCLVDAQLEPTPQRIEFVAHVNAQQMEPLTDRQLRSAFTD